MTQNTKIKNLVPNFAQYLVNNEVLEKKFFYPRYSQYVKNFRERLPILSSSDGKIVEELKKHGICVTSLSALGIDGTTEFVDAAHKLMEELAERAKKEKVRICS